jgi:hypothetical protein
MPADVGTTVSQRARHMSRWTSRTHPNSCCVPGLHPVVCMVTYMALFFCFAWNVFIFTVYIPDLHAKYQASLLPPVGDCTLVVVNKTLPCDLFTCSRWESCASNCHLEKRYWRNNTLEKLYVGDRSKMEEVLSSEMWEEKDCSFLTYTTNTTCARYNVRATLPVSDAAKIANMHLSYPPQWTEARRVDLGDDTYAWTYTDWTDLVSKASVHVDTNTGAVSVPLGTFRTKKFDGSERSARSGNLMIQQTFMGVGRNIEIVTDVPGWTYRHCKYILPEAGGFHLLLDPPPDIKEWRLAAEAEGQGSYWTISLVLLIGFFMYGLPIHIVFFSLRAQNNEARLVICPVWLCPEEKYVDADANAGANIRRLRHSPAELEEQRVMKEQEEQRLGSDEAVHGVSVAMVNFHEEESSVLPLPPPSAGGGPLPPEDLGELTSKELLMTDEELAKAIEELEVEEAKTYLVEKGYALGELETWSRRKILKIQTKLIQAG